MAEPKSNADLDLREVSRDVRHSTYQSVKPEAPDAGPQVAQILGQPSEDKSATRKKADA